MVTTAPAGAAAPMPVIERSSLLKTAQENQFIRQTGRLLDPRKAGDFCHKPGYQLERLVFEATCEIIAAALEDERIQSQEDFLAHVSASQETLDNLIRHNLQTLMTALVPIEEVVRSVDAYYKNASPAAEQDNTWFYRSNPDYPAFTAALCKYLLELYDDWVIGESPALLTHSGYPAREDILALSRAALQTNALFFFNIPNQDSLEELLEYARYNAFASADDEAAHAAAWCTPLAARTLIDEDEDYTEHRPILIGGATAVAGRFRALENPAKLPAGFRQGKLTGVAGPIYQTRKTPTTTLTEKYRLNPVALVESNPTSVGGSTLSTSDDESFNLVSKVAVRNRMLRALCQFATNITFENVDDEMEEAIISAVTRYLNVQKSGRVIKDYNEHSISVVQNPDDPQHYTINVDVALHQPAIYWEIQLNTYKTAGNTLAVQGASATKK